MLYINSDDHTFVVYKLCLKRVFHELLGRLFKITSQLNGRTVVLSWMDHRLRVWDSSSCKECSVAECVDRMAEAYAPAFCPVSAEAVMTNRLICKQKLSLPTGYCHDNNTTSLRVLCSRARPCCTNSVWTLTLRPEWLTVHLWTHYRQAIMNIGRLLVVWLT